MAVIDSVEVTISSDRTTLCEYAIPANHDSGVIHDDYSPATKVAVRYIEAVPGANFEINYSVMEDQEFGKGRLLKRSWRYVGGTAIYLGCTAIEQVDHAKQYRLLMFAADETPNATVDDIKARYGKIGSIRVEFSRKKRLGVTHKFEPVSLNEEPIPEDAIKGLALDLGVGLQNARPMQNQIKVNRGEIVDDGPLAIFIFLYRSRNALQSLGVLPSNAPAHIVGGERPCYTESCGNVGADTLAAELEAMRANVKKEKAESDTDMPRLDSIKREATDEDDNLAVLPVPWICKKVKVLDLTDD
ncbi:hypothetical protein G647_06756 [Cladophialophora carrionii CBS 160.54]|uniref:DUF7918 domain-containing protein n=1 Tax=Cladophialophora carrionii CBS 160.54 TaxID=1279043 RepID=V9D729_9EURO|nr:uncharacterized protein G647_06756 [Cladophialophora carrionii CBS 160.54]ETI22680.1 hypothetical protein G647_06756 [Cladophialophora carrionii CBS 160.54]